MPLQTPAPDTSGVGRSLPFKEVLEELASARLPAALPRLHSRLQVAMAISSFTVGRLTEAGEAVILLHQGDGAPAECPHEIHDPVSPVPAQVRGPRPTAGGTVYPLRTPWGVRGWMACAREGRDFDEEENRFLVGVAASLGLALAADTAAEKESESDRLELLAREVTTPLDLAALVDRIASRVHEYAGAPVALWLMEGERSRAVARAGGGRARLGEEQLLYPSLLTGETPVTPGSPAAVPLRIGTRTVGFLEIGPWTDGLPRLRSVEAIHRLSHQIATALENARLHAEVRRLSLTDPLVQLPNRRQLELHLAKECAAAARGRPLAVVMFDLDLFKEFNDSRGHLAGDRALVRFADVLRAETRAMNLAVRYGGEEFTTVLSGASLEGAGAHAERVRERVEEIFAGSLTVSAGVAAWRPEFGGPAQLLAAADRELYRAKAEGRNRVCVAET